MQVEDDIGDLDDTQVAEPGSTIRAKSITCSPLSLKN